MREIEIMIAEELASMIRPHMDGSGRTKFSEEVEIDTDSTIFVDGVVHYSISHEYATNYYHNVDVSVDIEDIQVYNSDGEEIKMKFNHRVIEDYMATYIED